MAGKPKRAKPGFFWQGVLILAPVAALVCFGLYSLQQDRLIAEQEARESAAAIAQQLALAISMEGVQQLRDYREASFNLHGNRTADLGLSSWAGGRSTQEAAERRIEEWHQANPEIDITALPPADARLYIEEQPETMPPAPPEWLGQLTADQQQLWLEAEESEFVAKDSTKVQSLLERFIASKPPGGARANAEYLLLLAKIHGVPDPEAANQIAGSSRALWGYSGDLTDTGLPIGQLICYQALRRLADGAGLPDEFVRHNTIAWMIAYRRSCFSPILIAETERVTRGTPFDQFAATLSAWWKSDAAARQVLEDFWEQHPTTNTWNPGPFWVDSSVGKFLLVLGDRRTVSTNYTQPHLGHYEYLLFPQVIVEKSLRSTVNKSRIPLPPYALVDFEMAGRKIALSRNEIDKPAKASLPILGQASGAWRNLPLNQHVHPFQISISLVSPEILYERQSRRTFLFGSLIVASALASLIGLITASRGFRKQLRLNEQKSNFVSSVSHELRAPIASVRLMAESLERGKISEPRKQHEYFKFIVQECRRLSSLIENVLDFSRIEQGRKQYEFEATDLTALVCETVKLMEPYAVEREVHLKVETFNNEHLTLNIQGSEDSKLETENSELILEIDGRAIQQALINLIDNAVKHSPKGQAVIVGIASRRDELWESPTFSSRQVRPSSTSGMGTRVTRPSEVGVELSVRDCGPGIPAAEHEKIFERFYRLGSELRRETQGVGIGLSIVKHIVEAHGGRVRVESEVGKGSCFTMELPVVHRGDTEARRRDL